MAAGTGVRQAAAGEAPALTALALRSKAHWGYPPSQLEAWRDDLTVTDDRLGSVWVAERSGTILGFVLLDRGDMTAEVDMLFVEPTSIGSGVGRLLLLHAVDIARGWGCRALELDADPHAEAFYTRYGARRIGETASFAVPGRTLPRMRITID